MCISVYELTGAKFANTKDRQINSLTPGASSVGKCVFLYLECLVQTLHTLPLKWHEQCGAGKFCPRAGSACTKVHCVFLGSAHRSFLHNEPSTIVDSHKCQFENLFAGFLFLEPYFFTLNCTVVTSPP